LIKTAEKLGNTLLHGNSPVVILETQSGVLKPHFLIFGSYFAYSKLWYNELKF